MIKKHSIQLLILASLFFDMNTIDAQHKNDIEAGLFNMGFGGVIGGIGAVINKKSNQKTGKIFLKGFAQGALGGYLLFESKRLVGKYGKTGNYSYVWPSKIINSAGVSIIENASANRNFWEQWHINVGFNRVEFYTKDKFKMSYRLMPFALVSTIHGFTKGKLNLRESLKIGSFIFEHNYIQENKYLGVTSSNRIIIVNEKSLFGRGRSRLISHELIHVYQYESFSGANPYFNKVIKKLNSNSTWSTLYHRIFYTDFNHIIVNGLHEFNSNLGSNFFENEARYYTDRH